MLKLVIYMFAVSSVALAAQIKIINIDDLRKGQAFKVDYLDYDDIEFLPGMYDGRKKSGFSDDDQMNNDASEVLYDNDYQDDEDKDEDTEDYGSAEDILKPYGALNHNNESLQPYGALNYKQHEHHPTFDHSAELYENSQEELLVIRKTTPKPLKTPKPPTNPFRLRLQRLFSNRRVVYMK